MLKSEKLTKKFGSMTAVNEISMELKPGHIYAMLGPNGSGKTTWMKMAAGLMKPTSGTVTFLGEPVGVKSRARVAHMSTEPYFYSWMTVKDVGKYYRDFFKDFSEKKYEGFLETMELGMNLKTKELSSGMAAKLKIAATMARDAQVYMLDEPFNGIDLLARDEIRSCILQEAGPEKLLILSSHLVEEVEAVADWAVFIRKGNLVEMRETEEMRQTDHVSVADRYREIYGHVEVQEA